VAVRVAVLPVADVAVIRQFFDYIHS